MSRFICNLTEHLIHELEPYDPSYEEYGIQQDTVELTEEEEALVVAHKEIQEKYEALCYRKHKELEERLAREKKTRQENNSYMWFRRHGWTIPQAIARSKITLERAQELEANQELANTYKCSCEFNCKC